VSIHIFRLMMDRWHLRPAARLSVEVMATSILDRILRHAGPLRSALCSAQCLDPRLRH
jgi:hypothetical protein